MGIFPMLGYIAGTIIPLIVAGYAIWIKYIKPRSLNVRLSRLYELISEWFDNIDTSNINDIDMNLMFNIEKKIDQFIEDNHLNNCKLTFTLAFRKRFLKYCGIKRELLSDASLFSTFSRAHYKGVYLTHFWHSLTTSFLRFKSEYEKQSNLTNFADVEMPIKLLKMYVGYRMK